MYNIVKLFFTSTDQLLHCFTYLPKLVVIIISWSYASEENTVKRDSSSKTAEAHLVGIVENS